MTTAEMAAEIRRLIDLLDKSLELLNEEAREYAEAEDAYRMAKARAYMQAEGTVAERQAQADLATSAERRRAYIADGLRQAALEAVRSRRGQLSAMQSLLAKDRAEAEFARTGGNA